MYQLGGFRSAGASERGSERVNAPCSRRLSKSEFRRDPIFLSVAAALESAIGTAINGQSFGKYAQSALIVEVNYIVFGQEKQKEYV